MNRRLYWIWAAMRDRCRNPNSRQYADYRQVHKRVGMYSIRASLTLRFQN